MIQTYVRAREDGCPARQFNENNGVFVLTDDLGRPWQIGRADKEAIEALREFGATRNPNLYVPHSNDGEEWLLARERRLENKAEGEALLN